MSAGVGKAWGAAPHPAKGIALGTRYLGWVWGWAPTVLLVTPE